MTKLLAQLTNPVLPKTIGEGSVERGGAATGLLIGNLIGGIFIFAFILAFFFLLTGGTGWILAGGDKGKLEEARNRITNAMIGLIIVGAGWAITLVVGQFLGLDLQQLPIPTIK